MCGIAGFIDNVGLSVQERKHIAVQMLSRLNHRGPDSNGIWIDGEKGVVLIHARLAIIDLSSAGAQPMFSASGRYVIVFNGEIYNFQEIRYLLEQQKLAPFWRGRSDTEVLLAAFEAWGVKKTLELAVGMFAFALWDCKTQTLYLAWDRIGEKPLYYGIQGKTFLFASELKALKVHPHFKGEIDRDVLSLYFRYNYIPTPYSIYKGIYKLQPGRFLEIRRRNEGFELREHTYWSLEEIVQNGVEKPFEGSEEDAVDELECLLRQALRGQMISDVPLGAFLSGGIDSSTITALMQDMSSKSIRTFSIGFRESEYNEAPYAKAIAQYLGTDHTEMYVTPREALDVIPLLPDIYDEPFADSSQIPTFLLSRLARRHVTVSLSGDGGDELFGGYNRYFWVLSRWNYIESIPYIIRAGMAKALAAIPTYIWDHLLIPINFLIGLLEEKNKCLYKLRFSGYRIHVIANLMSSRNLLNLYHSSVSHFRKPEELVLDSREPTTVFTSCDMLSFNDMFSFMQYLDQRSYLPDDILVKVDRAVMAVSLETRIPFLDHRIVEFTWRLPLAFKVRGGRGKWLLRQLLYRYVSRELVERPKQGFGVPIDRWLRGPLRDWAENLLNESRIKREGFLNAKVVTRLWHEYLRSDIGWHYCLWNILMFQAWLEKK